MFHELGTPKNCGWKWSQYFTYSLYGASERTVETRVGRHCGRLLGPLWADLAKILRDERARVWLWTMRISLMCIDVRGRTGWKTFENRRFSIFITVFQPLRPHMSTHIKQIPIICCHTLACLPRKILARSAHRGPSNVPQCRPTRVLTVHSLAPYSEYMKYWLHFQPRFLGVPSSWTIKYYTSKKT